MAFNVGEISAKVTGDTKPINDALEKTKTKGKQTSAAIGQSFQKVGKSMQTFGKTLTKYVTLPLLAVGTAAFKMGKDFEKEMSKIEGLVGIAGDVVDQWGKDILEMAPELAAAPKDLAEGMFFVTSAGLRGSEAMDVLEMSAKGAAGGLGEVSVIADAITSALNAYGGENLSAARATDILTAAVREGKLEAATIAPVLGRLLPMASKLEIGFNQVAGAIAVMSRTGAEATESATSLQSIMMFLQKPTKEARRILEDAGIAMSDLREIASKEPDGLVQVMRLLDKTFADDDEAIAQIIPNVRAFRGVMNILAQDADVVDTVLNNVTNSVGMAEENFAIASETAEFKWNAAISEMKTLFIELWEVIKDSVVPMIENMAEKMGNLIDKIRSMTDEQKENAMKWALIALAAGPVILILGKIVSAIGKIILIAPKLATALKAVGSALATPAGLAIAAIIALGAAVYKGIKDIETMDEYVERMTKDEINNINEAKDAKIQAAQEKYEATIKALEAEKQAVEDTYAANMEAIEEYREKAIEAEKDRLEEKISSATKARDVAIKAIREEYGVIESTTKSKTDIAEEYYDGLISKAQDAYDENIRLINSQLATSLKLLDEETREQVQAIQDQIDAINQQTEDEEKAIQERKDLAKTERLEKAVQTALTTKDKQAAQEELDAWLEEQQRDRLLAERENQIENLEQQIQDIKDNAADKEEELREQAETKRAIAKEGLDGEIIDINEKRDLEIAAIQEEREEKERQEQAKWRATRRRVLDEMVEVDSGKGHFFDVLDEEVEKKRQAEADKLQAAKDAIDEEAAYRAAQETKEKEEDNAEQEANIKTGIAILGAQNDYNNQDYDTSVASQGTFKGGFGSMATGMAIANAVNDKIQDDLEKNFKIDPTGGAGHFGYQYAMPTDYPEYAEGGYVNAPRGMKVPAFIHGGETVLPLGYNVDDHIGNAAMDKIVEAIYQGFSSGKEDESPKSRNEGGTLILQIDKETFGKIVFNSLTKEKQRLGVETV